MNAKTLVGMGAVAAAALALAVVASRRETASAAGDERPLLPALSERINDVRAVAVQDAQGRFTVRRGDGGWSVDEKGGYPADAAKPRELLLGLRGATIVEEKTSRPELYAELGVQDVEAPEAKSVLVEALGEDGAPIAALLVGERRPARGDSRRQEFYVRRAGEPVSWLVEGDLAVDAKAGDWLQKDVLDLARDRVRAVRIEHADGEVLYVRRPDETATDFTIVDLPEGKEPTHASAPGAVAAGLQRLTLEDVAPAAELELGEPPDAVATFWTFDGLRVTVATDEVDGELRARFSAAYDEQGPPGTELAGPPPPPEDDATADGETSTDEGGADASEADAEEEPAGPTPEEVRAEAQELDERLGRWTYVLPSWKKSAFQKRLSELTRDIAPPVEEPLPEEIDGLMLPSAQDEEPSDAEDAHAGHEHADDGAADDVEPPEDGDGDASAGGGR